MAEPSKLRLSELDFDQLRTNFKSYLGTQDEFKDYDTTGSAISVLLDLLAYNTHLNSYYMNMVANEMFLDTAVNRNSIMSLAKMLGYMPRSRKSAFANVNISVTPTDSPTSITIAKNTKFNTSIEGVSFTFVTDKSYSAVANNDNSAVLVENVKLIQGEPLSFRYTANTVDGSIKYKIPNRGVDTDTISVVLQDSVENNTQTKYTLATDLLSINSTSNVYFVEPDADDTYQVKFGDGVLGRKEKTGNIVILSYNITSGTLGNRARTFTSVSTVGGYSTASVTTLSASVGGGDVETNDSIRFNAPRHLEVQNRAVTATDYKRIITRDYPQAESVIVYGGEYADPPQYGKVFIGVKPKSGLAVTSSIKNSIQNDILKKYNVGSITTEFVDIDYIYPMLISTVNYDSRLTSKTEATLKQSVLNSITTFSINELQEFSKEMRHSKLSRIIDDTDTSIVGNTLTLNLKKTFIPTLNIKLNYTIKFSNSVFHPHTGHAGALTSSEFSILDGQDILRQTCKLDDLDGIIRVYRMVNGEKTIINATQGTIDYTTGKIVLNSFNPSTFNGSALDIIVKPTLTDVTPLREQLVLISSSNINLTMTDVGSVRSGLTSQMAQQQTTTISAVTATSTY